MGLLRWEEIEDKKFLYADFREVRGAALFKLTLDVYKELSKINVASRLVIIDSRDTEFNFSEFANIKEVARLSQSNINKSCILVSKDISESVIKSYFSHTKSKAKVMFDLKEAIEYIIS